MAGTPPYRFGCSRRPGGSFARTRFAVWRDGREPVPPPVPLPQTFSAFRVVSLRMSSDTPAVSMKDIEKRYGRSSHWTESISRYARARILALVGDNGAGKSTLINCLAGVHSPTSGRIEVDGRKVTIDSPRESKQLGIETTFQDLALASNLTVAQNIFLGREGDEGPRPPLRAPRQTVDERTDPRVTRGPEYRRRTRRARRGPLRGQRQPSPSRGCS